MNTPRQQQIFWNIWKNEPVGTSAIAGALVEKVSIPTLNRELAQLKKGNFIVSEGTGPSTKHRVNLSGLIAAEIDPELYFKTETDERKTLKGYNPEIFNRLETANLFSESELKSLESLTKSFQAKIKTTSSANYQREFERLMIELSWKSSQIEGNTYNLLDTEQLLKYNIPSSGHPQEEATMLLNHKAAIEYIRQNADLYDELSIGKIIDIHTLLIKGLNISKNLRKRLVRITGTTYTPPNNSFVIEESVEKLCALVNKTENAFTKAFLAVLLISYIQPFEDGNKRTARLLANAILMNANMCPLSYRSVNPIDYKKAMLLFYELNNVTAFKKIFVLQYQFAVENYF
jgi:Fic family protein